MTRVRAFSRRGRGGKIRTKIFPGCSEKLFPKSLTPLKERGSSLKHKTPSTRKIETYPSRFWLHIPQRWAWKWKMTHLFMKKLEIGNFWRVPNIAWLGGFQKSRLDRFGMIIWSEKREVSEAILDILAYEIIRSKLSRVHETFLGFHWNA